jgi:hypothetical protein
MMVIYTFIYGTTSKFSVIYTPDLRTSDNSFPIFGGIKRRKKMVKSGGNSVV